MSSVNHAGDWEYVEKELMNLSCRYDLLSNGHYTLKKALTSLKAKSLTALLLLALVNGTAASILFRSAAAQSSDSIQINLAGAERMLSQKMTKEALMSLRGGDPAVLAASIERFERVLSGLVKGDAELQLPGTNDPEILAGIAKVWETWKPFRAALEQIRTNPRNAGAAIATVEGGNMTLLTRMDQVVKLFEKRAGEKLARTMRLQVAITASLIILLFAAWLIVLRNVIRPLVAAIDYVGVVSAGDLTGELGIAFRERADEIGSLSRAMQTMSANLRAMIGEICDRTRLVLSSSAGLQENSARMSSGSRDTSDKAHSVAAAAEQMSTNVVSVAAGMEQTTSNLDHLARAAEEMTSTIGRISGNSEKARQITGDAARQANEVTEQIGRLTKAANEIDRVTESIMEISAQTNLLALNASIEAARAGSSGKGFAVLATEIKALAQQAGAATDDIRARIVTIQSATADSVGGVLGIARVIGEVSAIVASIAEAIDEQAGVTETIARNIAEATVGVREANTRVAESSLASRSIAEDIAAVDLVAGDMASTSDGVRTNAEDLAQVSAQLEHTVARFRV